MRLEPTKQLVVRGAMTWQQVHVVLSKFHERILFRNPSHS